MIFAPCPWKRENDDGVILVPNESEQAVIADVKAMRAEKLEAFRLLFDDPLYLESCEPCAKAALDAAAEQEP